MISLDLHGILEFPFEIPGASRQFQAGFLPIQMYHFLGYVFSGSMKIKIYD
jgi:hypothetical protein